MSALEELPNQDSGPNAVPGVSSRQWTRIDRGEASLGQAHPPWPNGGRILRLRCERPRAQTAIDCFLWHVKNGTNGQWWDSTPCSDLKKFALVFVIQNCFFFGLLDGFPVEYVRSMNGRLDCRPQSRSWRAPDARQPVFWWLVEHGWGWSSVSDRVTGFDMVKTRFSRQTWHRQPSALWETSHRGRYIPVFGWRSRRDGFFLLGK